MECTGYVLLDMYWVSRYLPESLNSKNQETGEQVKVQERAT